MNYRDRIVVDPAIRSGKPCIRGTRITVYDILEYLAGGMTEDAIIRDFPGLAREDIKATLEFAAARERKLAGSTALGILPARRRWLWNSNNNAKPRRAS